MYVFLLVLVIDIEGVLVIEEEEEEDDVIDDGDIFVALFVLFVIGISATQNVPMLKWMKNS